jgi:hypothetical protein
MGSTTENQAKNRLIVLVPDCLASNLELARKVHWIAIRERREVLYLTLVDNVEKLLNVSSCMAQVKAVTTGNWLVVNTQVTETKSWLKTLREVFVPGDMIICHEEQTVESGFFETIPLEDYLRSNFKGPVGVVAGFYHPGNEFVRNGLLTFLFWTGFLAIIAIFAFFEFRLSMEIKGLARSFLLMMVIFIEFGAIWAWNSITNR